MKIKKCSNCMFLFLFFCVNFFISFKLQAQSDNPDSVARLNPFVGKYQFTDNKMVFLQIVIENGHLVLKQLWDKQEIPFRQTSELEFYNDNHQFPLKFTKSNAGTITQVLAFNKDLWTRVADDYTPPMKKVIQLTEGQLKPLEGRYQLQGGDGDEDDFADITVVSGHLTIKREQHATSLLPVSGLEFVNEDQSFDVIFTKGTNGSITQAVVNNKDVWLKDK